MTINASPPNASPPWSSSVTGNNRELLVIPQLATHHSGVAVHVDARNTISYPTHR